jgi:hypothetical protein
MYMDAQNRPSNAQSLIAGAGTVVSTDSIDMLSAHDNPGRNSMLRAIAVLTTGITSGGAATLQAQLIESDNANLSSPRVLATGDQIAVAAGAQGTKLLDVPMPDTTKRYLGFQYIIGTAALTAGAVTAGLTAGTDRWSGALPMNTGL